MNVLHILPRAASWLIPGLNQITYYHDLTPLHLAAQNGLRDTVALLLQNGANINISTERSRWTPLLFALNNRQSLTAKSLIDQGAALTTEWGTNALHISAALDLPDIVEYLVKEKGIDPNSGDGFWDTPLIYAITSPYATEKSIPHLIALGADVNQVTFVRGQCWSPLGIALKCGRWELAEQLLDNGADPEHKGDSASSQQQTRHLGNNHPLSLALLVKFPKNQRARRHMIPKLLAKVNLGTEVSGSLLSTLVQRKLRWEIERLLRTGYVDVESRDLSGMTPLERALLPSSGSAEIAAVFLQHGARVPHDTLTEILRLTRTICQTPHASVIKETLDCNKALAPLFQLLLDHCLSLKVDNRDEVMTSFVDGCPPRMVAMRNKMKGNRLTNEEVLANMKEEFEFVTRRPRKAAPEIQNWFVHPGAKRRRLNNVQQKTFLANVTAQVIERHIVRGLEDLFSPLKVIDLPDDKVRAIVSEPDTTKRQRAFLTDRAKRLQEGQDIFRGVMGSTGTLV
ncbi:ankyrin repeat-containing domain protein [Xylariaceae sp. FL0255]|nr:ankyrin repeat-containing domain protein [Xylariaceae sp. FL0255]